jgi:hypothetical protein
LSSLVKYGRMISRALSWSIIASSVR